MDISQTIVQQHHKKQALGFGPGKDSSANSTPSDDTYASEANGITPVEFETLSIDQSLDCSDMDCSDVPCSENINQNHNNCPNVSELVFDDDADVDVSADFQLFWGGESEDEEMLTEETQEQQPPQQQEEQQSSWVHCTAKEAVEGIAALELGQSETGFGGRVPLKPLSLEQQRNTFVFTSAAAVHHGSNKNSWCCGNATNSAQQQNRAVAYKNISPLKKTGSCIDRRRAQVEVERRENRAQKLQLNRRPCRRRQEKRRVMFAPTVKTHDGLEPQNAVLDQIVWSYFNSKIRTDMDIVGCVPKELYLLSSVYDRLISIMKESKSRPGENVQILPRGGGHGSMVQYPLHYKALQNLTEMVRKAHNRVYTAAVAVQGLNPSSDEKVMAERVLDYIKRMDQQRLEAERKQRSMWGCSADRQRSVSPFMAACTA